MLTYPLAPAGGRQFLPEIPFPELTTGKEYAVYLLRQVRTRSGRVQPRVVRIMARLVDAREQRGRIEFEFLVVDSAMPGEVSPGHTCYLTRRTGECPDWRVSELGDPDPLPKK